MVSPIGPIPIPTTGAGPGNSVGIAAQIAQYRKQLSAQVNCASCSTLEGKAVIADLTNRIGTLQQRLTEPASIADSPANVSATTTATVNEVQGKAATASAARTPDANPGLAAEGKVGTRVNVFA